MRSPPIIPVRVLPLIGSDMYLRAITAIAITVVMSAAPVMAQEAPDGDLVGQNKAYTVVAGDFLASIARRNNIGYVELLSANPAIQSTTIKPGMLLVIPGQRLLPAVERSGVVVNLAALRVYNFGADGSLQTFPISVGREGWDTPVGVTKIVRKRKDPVWTVPASIRAEDPKLPTTIAAGPDNPLGQYAVSLAWPGYLLHGTNKPWAIGRPSSHGCMRLYPEDIAMLYSEVQVGQSVTVIDAPMTIGQANGNLYLQVTPTRAQAKQIAEFQPVTALAMTDAPVQQLLAHLAQLRGQGIAIDNAAVAGAVARHDGIPVVIAHVPPGIEVRPAQTADVAPGEPAQS